MRISGLLVLITMFFFSLSACVTEPDMDEEAKLSASEYNTQLGLGYLSQGNYEIALDKLRKAIKQNPENADAYYILMRKALSDRDRESAIAALKQIRAISADDVLAAYLLGILYLDDGQIDAALQVAAQLIANKPQHPAGYRIKGIALYLTGDLETALQNLQKSINGSVDFLSSFQEII